MMRVAGVVSSFLQLFTVSLGMHGSDVMKLKREQNEGHG
jgi:hypothetical protein